MAKTQILEYTIYLPDQALVDQYNANMGTLQGPAGPILIGLNTHTGQFEALGVLRAPYNDGPPEGGAAVEFAINAGIYPPALPIQKESDPFTGPAIRSQWFGTSANFPIDVATFTRKSGGWFGISFLFGSTTKFYWVGKFAYAAPKDDVVDPETGEPVSEPAPIPQRLMLCGYELEGNDTGDADGGDDTSQINSFTSAQESSGKGSSRWPGGQGFQFRPGNTSEDWAMQPLTTPAVNQLWDRVYFRIRTLPTGSRVIYEVENFSTSGSGFKLSLTAAGEIACVGFPSSGVAEPQFTTAALVVDRWYRLDILAQLWGTTGPPSRAIGRLQLYVNGVLRGSGAITPGGLVGNIKVSFTRTGDDAGGGSDVSGECDFDSWRTARMPKDKDASVAEWASGNAYNVGDYVQTGGIWGQQPSATVVYKALTTHGSPSPPPASSPATWALVGPSQDWLHGSRIERVRVTGLSVSNDGGWDPGVAGDDGMVLDTYPVGSASGAGPRYFSTTANAVLGVDTDVAKLAALPGSLGCVAAVIARYGWKTAGAASTVFATRVQFDGHADFTISGTAPTEGTVNAPIWWSYLCNFMNGTTELLAKTITAMELKTTKGNDANSSVTFAMHALVEVIGNFGAEDQPEGATEGLPSTSLVKGIHNGPYKDSPWYGGIAPPFAPVSIHGFTYLSDGLARWLNFPLPPHLVIIRKVAAASAPLNVWTPAMLSGHVDLLQRSDGHVFGVAERDATFAGAGHEDEQEEQYRLRIISADPRWNQSGQTYQVIAVCDPAKRAMICGAVQHEDSVTFPTTDALEEPTFLPIVAMAWPEGSSNNNSGRFAYKGTGHAAGAAQSVANGAALTSYMDFVLGAMRFQTNAFPANCHQTPYIVWRTNDGNGELRVWAHARYTGNGTSPRNITIAPAGGGRLPLWAMGVGNNNTFSRDPSHTGTTSVNNSNGTQEAANGIRGGGVDFITVGSLLNSNGQTYDLFVLLGGTTDSNGDGFSDNGDFFPAEPDTPTFGDTWEEPEEFTPDPGGGGGPGPVPGVGLDLDDDLGDSACVPFVHRVVNIALNRVGINKPITDLASELTAEASLVREHYDETLETTLRELPWPFATRYADLTLVAGAVGSPVNNDWTFSYRTPDDCVFPRRIVMSDRGESADAKGPPFIESSDGTGGLILTNEPDAQLEYTSRIECPPAHGDATFRSAWAWLLASELAPALSRMADRAVHCIEMFALTLRTARSFYKLGQPGLRGTVDHDPDENTLAEKLRIINVALARIGAQTLADLSTEQSREAILAALIYEDELRSCLRDHAWSFATRYASAEATPVTLTLVAGTIEDPAVPDWFFAFRAPTDMLFARRLVKSLTTFSVGRRFDPNPPRYRVGSDATGLLIYTNEEEPVLEYTIRPADVLGVADALFKDAFAWRLSAALAPSLGRPDPDKEEQTGQAPKAEDKPVKSEGAKLQMQRMRQEQSRWAWGMYLRALDMAAASDTNEQQREDDGDASWIRDRN